MTVRKHGQMLFIMHIPNPRESLGMKSGGTFMEGNNQILPNKTKSVFSQSQKHVKYFKGSACLPPQNAEKLYLQACSHTSEQKSDFQITRHFANTILSGDINKVSCASLMNKVTKKYNQRLKRNPTFTAQYLITY